MKKWLSKFYPTIIVLFAGLFLTSSLLRPGWYLSHDGIFHIYRTEEALSMLKLGHFPLRWAGNFDQGFGIPLFSFVYPLPYYISATLSVALGAIWSLKATTIASYILGGIGMYLLLSSRGRSFGLFGALIFLLTPYQFLNIFVRGTIGETLAIGLMPWVLYSYQNLKKNNHKLSWYHPIPLAGVLLAHNFLGILFTAFLFGYMIMDRATFKRSLASLFISLGLSAFFVLPMILQKNLLYSFKYKDLTFRFDQHFVTLKQLLYSKWDYWYSIPGDNDGMSFQLGIAQLILAILGIFVILFKSRKPGNLYLVLAYLGTIFLMHYKSYFIWNSLPLLQSIQFPWRFLFMPLILTPLFSVIVLNLVKPKQLRYFIMLLFLILAFVNIRNYRSPQGFFNNKDYTDLYRLYYNKTSTTFRTEILPKWSVPHERYKTDEILVNSGNMTIDAITHDPLKINVIINNKPDSSEGKVTILRNYYPGWTVTMDNRKKIEITPTEDGMILLKPELGVHNYEIKMSSTPIELFSNIVSLISMLTLGYLWYKNKENSSSTVK
ncbi:MAG: 6-pyruvoyl-tetrahydropterin synthase-related protein [Candidatus Microgenomates bacterium]